MIEVNLSATTLFRATAGCQAKLAGESRVLFDKTLVNQESAKIGRLRERYAA
jgi:hypothetical protein